MNFSELLDSTFCFHLTLTLAHVLWQGVVIAALAAGASWCLRGASAQSRYLTHVAALLLMVACLPVTFAVVYATVSVSASPPPEQETIPKADEAIAEIAAARPADVIEPPVPFVEPRPNSFEPFQTPDGTFEPSFAPYATETESIASQQESESVAEEEEPAAAAQAAGFRWQVVTPYATGVYFAGVFVMLVRLWLALQGGRRLRRRSRPVDDPSLLEIVKQQGRLLGLRFLPAVAYCERVAVPVVIGVLRPMILLPVSLATGLAPDQFRAILTHELIHLRRYDHLVNILQRAIEAVLFFHPAAWYVSWRINVEREHCCDDAVVGTGQQRAEYAESLIRVAELSLLAQTSGRSYSCAALGATGGNGSRLRERILRLIDGRSHEKLRLRRTWPIAFVLIAAALAATSLLMNVRAEPAGEKQAEETEAGAVDADVARALVAKLRNDDVTFGVGWGGTSLRKLSATAQAVLELGDRAVPALVEALDDTNRFAAAHVLLTLIVDDKLKPENLNVLDIHYPTFEHTQWRGLQVKFHADNRQEVFPGQIPDLKELWRKAVSWGKPLGGIRAGVSPARIALVGKEKKFQVVVEFQNVSGGELEIPVPSGNSHCLIYAIEKDGKTTFHVPPKQPKVNTPLRIPLPHGDRTSWGVGFAFPPIPADDRPFAELPELKIGESVTVRVGWNERRTADAAASWNDPKTIKSGRVVAERIAPPPPPPLAKMASEADRIVVVRWYKERLSNEHVLEVLKGDSSAASDQQPRLSLDARTLPAHFERMILFLRVEADGRGVPQLRPVDPAHWFVPYSRETAEKVRDLIPLPKAWGPAVGDLQMGLRVRKDKFAAGEDVPVEICIRNVGKKRVSLWQHRYNISDYYQHTRLTVIGPDGTRWELVKPAGWVTELDVPSVRTLEPGEVYIHTVRFGKWPLKGESFKPAPSRRPNPLTQRGRYTVRCDYSVLHKSGSLWHGKLVSNDLTVEVLPVKTGDADASTSPVQSEFEDIADFLEHFEPKIPEQWRVSWLLHCNIGPSRGTSRQGVWMRLHSPNWMYFINRFGSDIVPQTTPEIEPDAHVAIMSEGYKGKAPQTEEMGPARELAKWRGRRVFVWEDRTNWPGMEADIVAAFKAADNGSVAAKATPLSGLCRDVAALLGELEPRLPAKWDVYEVEPITFSFDQRLFRMAFVHKDKRELYGHPEGAYLDLDTLGGLESVARDGHDVPLATWRGRKIYISRVGRGWPTHEKDILAALRASDADGGRARTGSPETGSLDGPWGKAADGLQSRIVLPRTKFRQGEPIVAEVLVRNTSDKPIPYNLRMAGHDAFSGCSRFQVIGPDGAPVPDISRSIQVGVHFDEKPLPQLKPGQTRGVYPERLDTHHYMRMPGRYRITWTGLPSRPSDSEMERLLRPLSSIDTDEEPPKGLAPSLPPSGTVEIEVVPAPGGGPDGDLVGRLLKILPPGWKVNGAKLVTDVCPTLRTPGRGSEILLVHRPVPGTTANVAWVGLYVMDELSVVDKAAAVIDADYGPAMYLGKGPLGHVYLDIESNRLGALARWSYVAQDIAAALGVIEPGLQEPAGPDWGRVVSRILFDCYKESEKHESLQRFCRRSKLTTGGNRPLDILYRINTAVPPDAGKVEFTRDDPEQPYYYVRVNVESIPPGESQQAMRAVDKSITWDGKSNARGYIVERLGVQIRITVASDDDGFRKALNAILDQEITRVLAVGNAHAGAGASAAESPLIVLAEKSATQPAESDAEFRRLIGQLKGGDWRLRSAAAKALGEMGPKAAPAVPALMQVLEGIKARAEWNARNDEGAGYIIWALEQIGEPAIPRLIQAVEKGQSPLRERAVGILQRIGPQAKAAAPALVAILRNDAEPLRLRGQAATALGAIRSADAEVVATLVSALTAKQWSLRKRAAKALGEIGPPAELCVPALAKALTEPDSDVNRAAADALGKMAAKSDKAPAPLLKVMRDTDLEEHKRARAVNGLVQMGPAAEKVVPNLIAALGDNSANVRVRAAEVLTHLGPRAKDAVPALVARLKDDQWWVRQEAARALGAIGPAARSAKEALRASLNDRMKQVRQAAAEALKRIGREDATTDRKKPADASAVATDRIPALPDKASSAPSDPSADHRSDETEWEAFVRAARQKMSQAPLGRRISPDDLTKPGAVGDDLVFSSRSTEQHADAKVDRLHYKAQGKLLKISGDDELGVDMWIFDSVRQARSYALKEAFAGAAPMEYLLASVKRHFAKGGAPGEFCFHPWLFVRSNVVVDVGSSSSKDATLKVSQEIDMRLIAAARRAAPPATQLAGLDLDAAAKMLSEKVGGKWEKRDHPHFGLILECHHEKEKYGGSYLVMQLPVEEAAKALKKHPYDFDVAVRIIGSNDRCTVIEAASAPDPEFAASIVKALKLTAASALARQPADGSTKAQAHAGAAGASVATLLAEAETLRKESPGQWAQWDQAVAGVLAKHAARVKNSAGHVRPPAPDVAPLKLPMAYLVWHWRDASTAPRLPAAYELGEMYLRAIADSGDERRVDILLQVLGGSEWGGKLLVKAMTPERVEPSIRELLAGAPKLGRDAPLHVLLREFAAALSPEVRKASYDWLRSNWRRGPSNGDGEQYWETLFRLDLDRARGEVIGYYGQRYNRSNRYDLYVLNLLLAHGGPSEQVANAVRRWRKTPDEFLDFYRRRVLVCADPEGELEGYVADIEAQFKSGQRPDELSYLVRALVEHIPRQSVKYLRQFANDRRLTGLMGEGVRKQIVGWLVEQQDDQAEKIVARWLAEEDQYAQRHLIDILARQGEFARGLLKKVRPGIELPPLPAEKASPTQPARLDHQRMWERILAACADLGKDQPALAALRAGARSDHGNKELAAWKYESNVVIDWDRQPMACTRKDPQQPYYYVRMSIRPMHTGPSGVSADSPSIAWDGKSSQRSYGVKRLGVAIGITALSDDAEFVKAINAILDQEVSRALRRSAPPAAQPADSSRIELEIIESGEIFIGGHPTSLGPVEQAIEDKLGKGVKRVHVVVQTAAPEKVEPIRRMIARLNDALKRQGKDQEVVLKVLPAAEYAVWKMRRGAAFGLANYATERPIFDNEAAQKNTPEEILMRPDKATRRLLFNLLDDRKPIPLRRSMSPHYVRYKYRVCDYAMFLLIEVLGEKPGLALSEDLKERDRRVAELKSKAEEVLRSIPRATPAGGDEVSWGKPVDGLRCGWVRPTGPAVAGSAPEAAMRVENVGKGPAVFGFTLAVGLSSPNYTGEGHLSTFLSPRVTCGPNARPATVREVRTTLQIETPQLKDDDPLDGYYHVKPGAQLTLRCHLPLDSPSSTERRIGPVEVNGILYRDCHPVFSDAKAVQEADKLRCPPLMLEVVEKDASGKGTEATDEHAPTLRQSVEHLISPGTYREVLHVEEPIVDTLGRTPFPAGLLVGSGDELTAVVLGNNRIIRRISAKESRCEVVGASNSGGLVAAHARQQEDGRDTWRLSLLSRRRKATAEGRSWELSPLDNFDAPSATKVQVSDDGNTILLVDNWHRRSEGHDPGVRTLGRNGQLLGELKLGENGGYTNGWYLTSDGATLFVPESRLTPDGVRYGFVALDRNLDKSWSFDLKDPHGVTFAVNERAKRLVVCGGDRLECWLLDFSGKMLFEFKSNCGFPRHPRMDGAGKTIVVSGGYGIELHEVGKSGPLWTKNPPTSPQGNVLRGYDVSSADISPDGRLVVASYHQWHAGGEGFRTAPRFVVVYDRAGKIVCQRTFDGKNYTTACGLKVAFTGDGRSIVVQEEKAIGLLQFAN